MTSSCIGESLNELLSTPLDGDGERDSHSESESCSAVASSAARDKKTSITVENKWSNLIGGRLSLPWHRVAQLGSRTWLTVGTDQKCFFCSQPISVRGMERETNRTAEVADRVGRARAAAQKLLFAVGRIGRKGRRRHARQSLLHDRRQTWFESKSQNGQPNCLFTPYGSSTKLMLHRRINMCVVLGPNGSSFSGDCPEASTTFVSVNGQSNGRAVAEPIGHSRWTPPPTVTIGSS